MLNPKSHLTEVCRTNNLETPESIVELHSGVVNPAFCVNHKYIIRFNIRDLELRKFKREAIAYDFLAQTQVPVPKVIALDESRTILNADILITERLPGDSVSKYWQTLDNTKQSQLITQAAQHLHSIHNVGVPSFGPLDPGSKNHSSWRDYLGDTLQEHCRNLGLSGAFSDQFTMEQKIWAAFKLVEPLLLAVKEPKLIHGDFHFNNLIGTPTKITGVIDLEWSIGGDPEMDFRNPTNINESAHGAEPQLFTAYHRLARQEFGQLKNDFYRLMIKLELIPISLKHWVNQTSWGEENHRQILKTFEAMLEKLQNML